MIRATMCAGAAALLLLMGGCSSEPAKVTKDVSIGQQLIDLKSARDSGAISDKEYQRARESIIDNAS